jgi:long-chain-fatty-acyl-CoA reductase
VSREFINTRSLTNNETSMKKISIPKIICGEVIESSPAGMHEIEYSNGVCVCIPKLIDDDLEKIYKNRSQMHHLPLSDITRYLQKSGQALANAQDPFRERAAELGSLVTGLSPPMIHRDFKTISSYLKHRNVIYDLLDAELGDHAMMDEWVRNQVARVRAFPRGRALHVLVGNVPIAGLYSIMRSIITKNHTLVKLPSRDLITSLYFCLSLLNENESTHPVSKSLSAFYCERNSGKMTELIKTSDLVCAWGGGSAIESVKSIVPSGIPFLEFGPKRSLAIVYPEDCDVEKAAMRIASDFSIYDQEACFSPQHLFVIGSAKKLIPPLIKYMNLQAKILPVGKTTPDNQSHRHRAKLEAIYRGWKVHIGNNNDWMLVEANNIEGVTSHPLTRTIYLHSIDSADQVLPFVDDEMQTIGVYPFDDRVKVLANQLCARGACRLCEIGMAPHFRQGFSHDGTYPLQQFVRMAYIDSGLEYTYKYGNYTLDDYEAMLFGANLIKEGECES